MKRMRGISLLQFVLALLLVAILSGVAAPALARAYLRAQFAHAALALADSALTAARIAVATRTAAVICPGRHGACEEHSNWSDGWLVFADLDGDRRFGPGDTLLHRQPAFAGGVALTSNLGRKRVVFHADGDSAGSNLTFVVCARSQALGQRLVLSNAGRLHAAPADPEQIERCRRGQAL